MPRFARISGLFAVHVLLLVLLPGVAACGDDPAGDEVSSTADAADVSADTGEALDSGTAIDTATGEDSAGALDSAADKDIAVDAGPEDTGPIIADCPGQPGCDCQANADCDNNLCVPHAQASKCAKTCVDSCPVGYKCAAVSSGGADTVQICVPHHDWLCDPCTDSEDCGGMGLGDAACVSYGSAGNFCGIACADDKGCPADYRCVAGTSVDGKPVKQCVRKDDKGEPYGACSCSDAAVAKQLETACFIEHKNDKGELVGKCAGDRTCGKDGLTACQAPSLAPEACNGLDDDCDGQTDEATCDDNNTCTLDACDKAAAGGKPACVHKKLDAQPCDADGSACTEKDACDGGLCVPGKPINCDDGNGCTTDACDPAKGCTQTDDDGKACEADGNPCTEGDSCDKGTCKVGGPKACSSGDVCVLGKCDPSSGKCAFKNIEAPCDDGNACTDKDACDGGFCTGKPTPCDDNNACTADTCDKAKGCVHTGTTAPCDDGQPCTHNDACSAVTGKCAGLPLTATACDDNNPCTDNACDPSTGKCAAKTLADGKLCDADGSACTQNDACKAGKCAAGTALPCDDLNACTTDACDPNKGCVHSDKSGGCDDGNACTAGDACGKAKDGNGGDKWGCVGGKEVTCDDGNLCTIESCVVDKGCVKVVDTSKSQPCYSGGQGTQGVGTCKAGTQKCQADGSLGACVGEVTPNKPEVCDGKDDDCDGKTDVGCSAAGFSFRVTQVAIDGAGVQVRQVPVAGAAAGQKTDMALGWPAWLKRWIQ